MFTLGWHRDLTLPMHLWQNGTSINLFMIDFIKTNVFNNKKTKIKKPNLPVFRLIRNFLDVTNENNKVQRR